MKRVTIVAVGLLLAALMVSIACGPGATPTPSPSPTPTPTAPPTSEPLPDEIKIGILGPMKFSHGQHMMIGAQIAEEEINANGGVSVGGQKVPIKLVELDTNEFISLDDAAAAMTRGVTSDGCLALIGGIVGEAVIPMREIAMDNKAIYVVCGSNTPEVGEGVEEDYERYKYNFHTQSYIGDLAAGYYMPLWMEVAARAVREQLGVDTVRVALFGEQTEGLQVFIDELNNPHRYYDDWLNKLNLELVGTWQVSRVATDLTPELTALRAAKPHVVMQALTSPVGVAFGRQFTQLEIPAVTCGYNVEGNKKSFWEESGGAADYLSFSHFFVEGTALTPRTAPFLQKFEEKTGDWPAYTATAYSAVYIIAEGIERAGSLAPDAVVAGMEETDFTGPEGRYVFESNHRPKYGPDYLPHMIGQWRDGKVVPVWPDGKATTFEAVYEGSTVPGVRPIELPPWMIEYWKKQM